MSSDLRKNARIRAIAERVEELRSLMLNWQRRNSTPLAPKAINSPFAPPRYETVNYDLADLNTTLHPIYNPSPPAIAAPRHVTTDAIEEISMPTCVHTDKLKQNQNALILRMQSAIRVYYHSHNQQWPRVIKVGLVNNMLLTSLLRNYKYFPETDVIVEGVKGLGDTILCEG